YTHGGQSARSGGEQSAAQLLRDHVLIGHSSNAFGILCKQASWPVASKTASGSLLAKRMLVCLSHDQMNGVQDQKKHQSDYWLAPTGFSVNQACSRLH
ncbi:hypothetical protein Tco_0198308, partial [Tanacetum coccineum]